MEACGDFPMKTIGNLTLVNPNRFRREYHIRKVGHRGRK
jgi:hypothetical protein